MFGSHRFPTETRDLLAAGVVELTTHEIAWKQLSKPPLQPDVSDIPQLPAASLLNFV